MQKQVETIIDNLKGPQVILAGAGTGKTYTIVEKIKRLLASEENNADKILCLTFSNEAASSLQTRIKPHTKNKEPLISTFHAFCADLLRKHGSQIGIKETFKILLPDDAKIILHKNFKLHPRLCVQYIENIGLAKDLGITITDIETYLKQEISKLPYDNIEKRIEVLQFELNTSYLRKSSKGKSELKNEMQYLIEIIKLKKFLQSWKAYEKIKSRTNMLDYGDLNIKALELLNMDANAQIKNSFNYIIIDEFQDTNKQQLELLKALKNNNITIVGDLNQSIYQFRGAYKNVFSEFKEFFNIKPENVVNLERSFRSPNSVLRAAHAIIKNNYQNQNDCFQVLNAYNREEPKVTVYEMKNEKEEARKVLEIIEKHHLENEKLEDICVMFRTHQQARQLKTLLDAKKVPYQSIIKKPLLSILHIRKILDYLSIAHKLNKDLRGGEHEWWNILNSQTLNLDHDTQTAYNKIIRKSLEEAHPNEYIVSEIKKNANELVKELLTNLEKIQIFQNGNTNTVSDIINFTQNLLNIESTPENKANTEKLLELVKSEFDNDLEGFLYHLEIMQKIGINIESVSTEHKGVRIMTNHSTKGLEYKTVICCGFAQGKFPSEKIKRDSLIPKKLYPEIKNILADVPPYAQDEIIEELEEKAQLAEERRLCYVAFTRAKENLIITYAKNYGTKDYPVSRFLEEADYKNNPHIVFEQDLEEKHSEIFNKSNADPNSIKLALPKKISFSPSALLLFTECKKKYEYKYIRNMPEKEPASWEEIMLGSFVHEVIEQGVNSHFASEQQFTDLALAKAGQEEWRSVNLADALPIIRIFYERNKNKYSSSSLTEIKLRAQIDNLTFEGYADRIDVRPEGIEIIDYKTGKTYVSPRHRNWQLGIYALAATSLNLGKVKKLTLDMLRHEKPFEFELLDNGLAKDKNSKQIAFDLNQVKQEIVQTAREILDCYEHGFAPCPIEQNCEFCNEHIWKT